jgi:hypothetical protein
VRLDRSPSAWYFSSRRWAHGYYLVGSVGTFFGYKPGRIYELSDGSKWTQEDLTDEPVYRDDPTARLLFSGSIGAIYLDVEGTSAVVRVYRNGSRPTPTAGAF